MTYDVVAGEYYDAALHPTCATFWSASLWGFERVVASLDDVDSGPALELGAGRLYAKELWPARPAVALDASRLMLAHATGAIGRIQAIAQALPFGNGTFGRVVLGMCDPYNDSATWGEVGRVLSPAGYALVSMPSHLWAKRYRELEGSPFQCSWFTTRLQESVLLPSLVSDPEHQTHLFRCAGLQEVITFAVTPADLNEVRVPRKISSVVDRSEPFLTVTVLRRG